MSSITIAQSAVTAKLVNAPHEAKLAIQELLSFKIDGGSTADPTDKWSGRSSFFTFNSATFPAGFVGMAMARLQQLGHTVHRVRKPLPAPLGPESPRVDEFGNDDPRYDFQGQTVEQLLKIGQIIAQVATGGGKSKIAKLATLRIGRPTLFLTTRSILMHQMAKQYRALGRKVGVLGDGVWKPVVGGINVGLVQTLTARLQKDAAGVGALLASFELVILEEAHEVSSRSFSDVMNLCTSAHYRLALTATPFMKASEEANMRLMAASGPIAVKVSEDLLIKRGILATPTFKIIRLEDEQPEGLCERFDFETRKSTGELQPAKLMRSTPWPKCYEVGIVHGVKRNGITVYEARRAAAYGLPVMVLVQREAHGKKLQTLMSEAGLRVNFIFGKHEQTEREAALEALKGGRLQVLIGSTILDVGVDVPAVGMIIIAGAGKAEVQFRQRIGRGLRAKKGINRCYVVDFNDWQNNDLRDHSKQRRAILDATPGFAENILAPGRDFDFAGDGFNVKVAA